MFENSFSDADKESLTNFLNYVYQNAKFDQTTKDAFEFTRLYSQTANLVKKIEAHILEVKRVVQAKPAEPAAPEEPKGKKAK